MDAPARNAGAQRLGAGFFGSEAFGIGFGRQSATTRLSDLAFGEAAAFKALTETVQGPSDAFNVTEIVADTDNHARASSISSRMC